MNNEKDYSTKNWFFNMSSCEATTLAIAISYTLGNSLNKEQLAFLGNFLSFMGSTLISLSPDAWPNISDL